ncbi:MAG: hypothetical protein WCI57_04875 [Candidatus Berkelbacteria bacterium]
MNLLETAIAIILALTAMSLWVIGFICWMASSVMAFIQTIRGLAISPATKKLENTANAIILGGLVPAAVVMFMLWQHLGK